MFADLNLIEPLRRALAAEGYERPTPIQEQAIPPVLEGRDLLGSAQTGTGKTAAFALPMLQRLAEKRGDRVIRALILCPTRELAAQIDERIAAYGKHLGIRGTVIYGGVSQVHQIRALQSAPQVVVATPGRLLDLCSQRKIDLSRVEILVLDEADRMLDMGFIHDVRRIVSMTPVSRQTLLFSATMPAPIAQLAKSILRDPIRVEVAPAVKTAGTVGQSVFFVARPDKRALLVHLLKDAAIRRVLVFTRTKHAASRIAGQLERAQIPSGAIHGDKTQGARERALAEFRGGATRVLVATDIAARGIDVDGISHVVNYDLPADTESYVHRIGRTGRAGASGLAFSFCDSEERPLLAAIERLIGTRLPVVTDHPYAKAAVASAVAEESAPAQNGGRGPQREGSRGQSRAPSNGQGRTNGRVAANGGGRSAGARPVDPAAPPRRAGQSFRRRAGA